MGLVHPLPATHGASIWSLPRIFKQSRNKNSRKFVVTIPAALSQSYPPMPAPATRYAPVGGVVDTYVAKIRYEPLRLATGRTSENYSGGRGPHTTGPLL
jgi:hypothetical protein